MISTSRIIPCQEFATGRPKLALDGVWSFSYDPNRIGEKEKWFSPHAHLPEKTSVPGCPQVKKYASAGKAVPVENECWIPFKHACNAPAWHAKTFSVPAGWQAKEIWLHMGGLYPAALIWCNGRLVGYTNSSRTPLRCNLTKFINCGKKNTLAIKLYLLQGSRLEGIFDGKVWTGIYRSIWLEAVEDVCFKDIYIQGRIQPASACIEVMLQGRPLQNMSLTCDFGIKAQAQHYVGTAGITPGAKTILNIPMPGARLWSPEEPNLYEARLALRNGQTTLDTAVIHFGLREIRVKGTTILLNRKPVFLRGASDDHIYLKTGCPPASKAFFKKRIRLAKKYGFNFTKSCVEIFTQEFVDAADECGYLVCQEMPFGLISPLRFMRFDPAPKHAAFLRQELQNIVIANRGHASVIMFSMASELYLHPTYGYPAQSRVSFDLFCREFPRRTRMLSPSTLVCDITHNETTTIKTHFGPRDTDILENCCAGQGYMCPLTGPIRGLDKVERPFLLHEYNWWTCLPDPSMLKRYQSKDVVLKPSGISTMLQQAEKNGLASQLPVFVKNSRKLKYTIRKDGLELARRHEKIAGYNHWLIHDYGSWSPEGVFNEFWEAPQDLSAREFSTYNNNTVLLWEDHDQRAYEWGQSLVLTLRVSHFGQETLDNAELSWRIQQGTKILLGGKTRCKQIRPGSLAVLGNVNVQLPVRQRASRLELRAELRQNGKQICWNHWPLWAYPAFKAVKPVESGAPLATDVLCVLSAWPQATRLDHRPGHVDRSSVVVTNRLSHELIRFLAQGGRLALFIRGQFKDSLLPVTSKLPGIQGVNLETDWDVNVFYRSIPWNGVPEGNMGTVVQTHPALGDLPRDGWCDLNFAPLIQGMYPVNLEPFLPARIQPIIRSIGSWQTMRDKAYLFEVGVGQGSLLVCSLGIEKCYAQDLTARYLLRHLLKYIVSPRFAPRTNISPADFMRTLEKVQPPESSTLVTQLQVSPARPLPIKFSSLVYPRRRAVLNLQARECPLSFCDLRDVWTSSAKHCEFVYMACRFVCASAMKLKIGLGYGGPVKVWLDGRKIFCDPAICDPLQGMNNSIGPDKVILPFNVAAGRHEVMIALASNGSRVLGTSWGTYLRFIRRGPPLFAEPANDFEILNESHVPGQRHRGGKKHADSAGVLLNGVGV